MPRPSLHVLIWSEDSQQYELRSHGKPEQWFTQGDEPAFARWLAGHTAFAFVGRAGRLSVRKEGRGSGRGYWYAYRKQDQRIRKGYLGPSARVTFARLEEQARSLTISRPAPPLAHGLATPLSELSIPCSPPNSLLLVCLSGSWSARVCSATWMPVCTHPLTLVSASAGSGKTTLLSAWVAASRMQTGGAMAPRSQLAVAWLSLDTLDNDPIRFWASCIVSLQSCLPMFGGEALALLHAREAPPLSTILMNLLNEIVQLDQEVILILDDFHLISDQTIHEGLLFVLDHLPANLHLILATRTDPLLPLSRLRVRGQLLEIRSSDLRFTRLEASTFLMEQAAPIFWLNGEARTIQNWVLTLPDTVLCAHTRLALNAALRFLNSVHISTETVYISMVAQVQRTIVRMEAILYSQHLHRRSRRRCLMYSVIPFKISLTTSLMRRWSPCWWSFFKAKPKRSAALHRWRAALRLAEGANYVL